MVSNLVQLAPLLQHLFSLELGLETANAAAGLVVLQQLHSLRSLKLTPSTPGRQLRLEFASLRLLPSSLIELVLHFVPALGDDLLANMFPTACFQNLRRLVLYPTVHIQEAEPFQATDALCPLLTWLEVVGPTPERDWAEAVTPGEETLSAQFLTRFPAIKTVDIAEGHVRDIPKALEDMPHLVAARLHLNHSRPYKAFHYDVEPMWMPVHQHLQILQLNLRGVDDGMGEWHMEEAADYDLSAMPNLKWAVLIGPYLQLPAAIPRSLSKLLLVSNNGGTDDEIPNNLNFKCDLSSLDLLALITMQDQCNVYSNGFSRPRLLLHEGDPTCNAEFPSDGKWYILMARSATLNAVAEHLTAQVDGHGTHCQCDGGGAHLLQPFAPSPSDRLLTYTSCRCLRGHKPGCCQFHGSQCGRMMQREKRSF